MERLNSKYNLDSFNENNYAIPYKFNIYLFKIILKSTSVQYKLKKNCIGYIDIKCLQ